jgi:hypothetical protein
MALDLRFVCAVRHSLDDGFAGRRGDPCSEQLAGCASSLFRSDRRLAVPGVSIGQPPQYPDKHRPERPILLAVDQELGEGTALQVASLASLTVRPPVTPGSPGDQTPEAGAVGVDAPERTCASALILCPREEDPVALG